MRRGSAGKEGAWFACFNRGHVARFEARSGVPDSENTAMNGDQTAACEPIANLLRRDAGADELVTRHDSV
jgi:hypothetical protein